MNVKLAWMILVTGMIIAAGWLACTVTWIIFLFRRKWKKAAGYFSLSAVLFLTGGTLLMLIPAHVHGHREHRVACMAHLSQIGKAMKMYAMDHNDEYPSSLSALTNYADNPRLYACPGSGTVPGSMATVDQWSDYVLVTGLTERSAGSLVHAYCKVDSHRGVRGRYVLLVDGAVLFVFEKDYGSLSCDVAMEMRTNRMDALQNLKK